MFLPFRLLNDYERVTLEVKHILAKGGQALLRTFPDFIGCLCQRQDFERAVRKWEATGRKDGDLYACFPDLWDQDP